MVADLFLKLFYYKDMFSPEWQQTLEAVLIVPSAELLLQRSNRQNRLVLLGLP